MSRTVRPAALVEDLEIQGPIQGRPVSPLDFFDALQAKSVAASPEGSSPGTPTGQGSRRPSLPKSGSSNLSFHDTDVLEAGEPLLPTPKEESCPSRCRSALALLQAPTATTLALGAGSCCLALGSGGLAEDAAALPLHPLMALLLGCSASAALPARLRFLGALVGCWLPGLRWQFREGAYGGTVMVACAWGGAGLALAPVAQRLCSVRTRPGATGLYLSAAVSAVLGGSSAGQRCAAAAPQSAGTVLAILQAAGLLLLPPLEPRANQPLCQDAAGARNDALRLAGNAAQTSWFWSLVGIAVSLGQPARTMSFPTRTAMLASSFPLALSPLVWGFFGYVVRWHEPRTLQLLGSILGLGCFLLEYLPDRLAGAARSFLWHLLLAAVPLTASSLGFCCRCPSWQPVAFTAALAAATVERAVVRLARPSWLLGVLGPLYAARLCSFLLPHSASQDSRRWVQGYAALWRPGGGASDGAGLADGAHDKEGLPRAGGFVGELRGLAALALLLRPMTPLAAIDKDDPAVFNHVLAHLWPYVRKLLEEDILKGEVEPILKRQLTGAIRFDRISLGDMPPRIHAAWVVPPTPHTNSANTITLALDVEFDGRQVDVALKLGLRLMQLSLGITRLSIRGRLFIAFRHLTQHLPLTQGINIFFANPPEVKVELGSTRGAVSLLPESVKAEIKGLFSRGVDNALVLPNKVAVPFGLLWPLARLKHSPPEGILRCRVIAAWGVMPPNGFTAAQALTCQLQMGAHVWSSAAVQSSDGDFEWNEQTTLVVDDRANQELKVILHEQQTFGSVQVTEQRSISTTELVEQSCRQQVPQWHLPSADSSLQLLLAAAWHPLTNNASGLYEGLGSLLVLTVDSAKHVPAAYEGTMLVVHVYLLERGEVSSKAKPDAASLRKRASSMTPMEGGRSRLRRLQRLNFPEEEGGGFGEESFLPSNADRWRERLEQFWLHFHTADGRHLSDWVHQDRNGCVQALASMLGVSVWDEQRFGEVVDEVSRTHGQGRRLRSWTRSITVSRSANGRPSRREVECHWRQQLRLMVANPQRQEVVVELAHVGQRKEPRALGTWRMPLRDLLAKPQMTDRMNGRNLQLADGGRDQDSSHPLTLYAQLELLHLLPAEQLQRH